MKTRKVTVLAAVILTVMTLLASGCSIKKELVGEWVCREQVTQITYIFNRDGTLDYMVSISSVGGGSNNQKVSGKIKTKGDKLILSGIYLDVESKEYVFALSEDGNTLTLTRDGEDMVLTKVE